MASATNFFDFTPKDKRDQEYPLSQHKGKVILAVNTASKCGFTPQFKGLEELWKSMSSKYPDQFVIIGFPCNQFGGQDPGSNEQIQEFCQLNYGVSFPVLGKTDVNGGKAEPVFEWMKAEKPGLLGMKRIKWNFEKFLIDRDGKVVQRYSSMTKPESMEKDIISAIDRKSGQTPPQQGGDVAEGALRKFANKIKAREKAEQEKRHQEKKSKQKRLKKTAQGAVQGVSIVGLSLFVVVVSPFLLPYWVKQKRLKQKVARRERKAEEQQAVAEWELDRKATRERVARQRAARRPPVRRTHSADKCRSSAFLIYPPDVGSSEEAPAEAGQYHRPTHAYSSVEAKAREHEFKLPGHAYGAAISSH